MILESRHIRVFLIASKAKSALTAQASLIIEGVAGKYCLRVMYQTISTLATQLGREG